jgi:hypothetical protein
VFRRAAAGSAHWPDKGWDSAFIQRQPGTDLTRLFGAKRVFRNCVHRADEFAGFSAGFSLPKAGSVYDPSAPLPKPARCAVWRIPRLESRTGHPWRRILDWRPNFSQKQGYNLIKHFEE